MLPTGGALRFFTQQGVQTSLKSSDTYVYADSAGVKIETGERAAINQGERQTQGNFITVTRVTFPNGRVHLL